MCGHVGRDVSLEVGLEISKVHVVLSYFSFEPHTCGSKHSSTVLAPCLPVFFHVPCLYSYGHQLSGTMSPYLNIFFYKIPLPWVLLHE